MAWSSTGSAVKTSKQAASSILYAGNGQIVRQWEVVETTETRALAQTAATGAVPASANEVGNSDTTTETQYWAHLGGKTVSIVCTTGTRTDVSAARANDSNGWIKTVSVHTFFVTGLGSVWGTTELDEDGNAVTASASGTEVVLSYERTISRIAWDVYSTIDTTVKEFRNIDTEANARNVVARNIVSGPGTASVCRYEIFNGNLQAVAWVTYSSGTNKTASARRNGKTWTVTVTQRDYSWYSPNASPTGPGWR